MRRIIILIFVICCVYTFVHASLTDGLNLRNTSTESINYSSYNNINDILYCGQLVKDRFGNQKKIEKCQTALNGLMIYDLIDNSKTRFNKGSFTHNTQVTEDNALFN